MRPNIGFTRPVVQMNNMQFIAQQNLNRQQTIIAQPRPLQSNQVVSPFIAQRPPTMIYPNVTTAVPATIPTGILKNGIQQPFVQTP